MIECIAISLVAIALLTDLLLVIFWTTNFKSDIKVLEELPEVDILIAARNEEDSIPRCLDSMVALNYPKEKLHVWVGDDESTDTTWSIVQKYAEEHSFIKGVQITEHIISGNGKANVLAQLAHLGSAKWMFTTDADIAVPNQWIKSMLGGAMVDDSVLVTGTSLVEGQSFLARFQRMEWLYATSMLKVVSDMGVQASTMGNNMVIKRDVYESLGGYENIPFSVTEDLELFRQLKGKYRTTNLFVKDVLNKSVPQTSLLSLYIQRKRWMRGAFQLPLPLLVILVIQAVYFPSVILLIVMNPLLGSAFWMLKWFTKYSFLSLAARKLNEKVSIFDSFVMDWVSVIFSITSLVYYFWPGKIKWKGRTY